jgi:two-component system heavy metal sensor histidine kinase CusS
MKSIGSRITLWYATTLTATLACLFIAGHFLLDHYLLRQLDELNEAQFKHLKATLGRDYAKLTPVEIDDRIRQATESASSLFYIDMHGPMTNRFFKSSNLHGQAIPDIAGERAYSVAIDNIGEVRVSEFQLAPFDVIVATPLAPVRELMTGYRLVFFGLLGTALVLSVVVGYGAPNGYPHNPSKFLLSEVDKGEGGLGCGATKKGHKSKSCLAPAPKTSGSKPKAASS